MDTTRESQANDSGGTGSLFGRRNVARLYFLVAAALALAALTIQITTRDTILPPAWGFRGFSIAISASVSIAGLVVASRNPQNLIGWLLLTAGFVTAIQALVFEYAVLALLVKPEVLAGGAFFAWLDGWIWVLGMGISTTLVLLLFPEGRLPSRRWVPVVWISILSIALGGIGLGVLPGASTSFESVKNPIAIDALADKQWLISVALAPLLGSIVASASSLVVRYKKHGF